MIKKGTIIEWSETIAGYAAQKGSLAIATTNEDKDGIVDVKWLPQTKHLSGTQNDGGYYADMFHKLTLKSLEKKD